MAELRDYQIPHAMRVFSIIRRRGAVLDGSDTGTGKTYVAAQVARELGRVPIVLTLKTVRAEWREILGSFGHGEYYVNNYEQYKRGKTPYVVGGLRWKIDHKKHIVIFDEVHVCRSRKSQNGKMLLAAKRSGVPILMLSATVAETPLHMEVIGFVLGLFHTPSGFWDYAFTRGAYRGERGLEYPEKPAKRYIEMMHRDIYERRGSRMQKGAIPGFPESQILPVLLELGEPEKLKEIYKTVRDLTAKIDSASETDLPFLLTERMRNLQRAEAFRIPLMVDMVHNELDQGRSVIIFMNYVDSLSTLRDLLADLEPVSIYGGQKDTERSEAKRKFQADESRVILCITQAGGVALSLHDVRGQYPRTAIHSPTDRALNLVQAIGRPWRDGAKSTSVQYICYARGTVEERVYRRMKQKVDNIQTINDGDLNPFWE